MHPATEHALSYLQYVLSDFNKFGMLLKIVENSADSSLAIAFAAKETIKKISANQSVSDTEILGCAWFVKYIEENAVKTAKMVKPRR